MFVIHLGVSGFPQGNAQIQRIRLTFKSLKLAGCNPLIINKHALYQVNQPQKIDRFQGIPFINTSISKNRPDGFLARNFNKFSGYLIELLLLVKKRKKIHSAIFYGSSFGELVYYRILSKLLNFKLVIQYVEYRSAIPLKSYFINLNNKLFDANCAFFCDGIIVISEFLKSKVLCKKSSLKMIKIPAICDFTEFELKKERSTDLGLMYCGSIFYLPVIYFIIELYAKLRDNDIYPGDLVFAIGMGSNDKSDYEQLIDKINANRYSKSIQVKTNVPFNELISMYLHSELLIVPLRNSIPDIAGFHHKIGEYTAAGKPIISSNFGELQYYFKDGYSAILADEYSVDSYFEKLSKTLKGNENLNLIAEEGHKVGATYLNYKSYAHQLKTFLHNL